MRWLRSRRSGTVPGWVALAMATAAGLTLGLFNVLPVRSQTLHLEAVRTTEAIAVDEPWSEIWDRAPRQEVPLSAQNLAPPFGGGTVAGLTARALYDEQRIYLLLEWADSEADAAVNATRLFSDAAAVQFPSIPGTSPPFTMGSPGTPVNIWQWKAVWQADLDSGYAASQSRFPNTYVDYYPNEGDPRYRPAEYLGNSVAERVHPSPVENLLAEGFGSLTTAPVQDVEGAGEWRSGTWRALFVRTLIPTEAGYATFSFDEPTMVAFAVWNGGESDRNGQKSIAPFVDLTLGDQALPGAPVPRQPDGSPWVLVVVVLVLGLAVLRLATWGERSPVSGPGVRVVDLPPPEDGTDR